MPEFLKNSNLEIQIDLPGEGYNFSRFDWTGKITQVKFQNVPLTIVERTDDVNDAAFGKGFYNEFGIDTALGFKEAAIGGWFHKIGVGLLKKRNDQYLFHKKHEIKPAQFKISKAPNKVIINCISETVNGYAYVLRKEIALQESGFTINYILENTGDRDIRTDEYVHNFMAINKAMIGNDYELKFPFKLRPERFGEAVNSEQQVMLGPNGIGFKGTPREQFFFSNLSGGEQVSASWELLHHTRKIGISETGSFKTKKVNLWGWEHVISPELFVAIHLQPGQSRQWSRMYKVFRME
ncbi:MAG: hypothetical protein HKP42_10670 [Maribacter sp.]|nr:hypothetical protein [Maribacter sp.]NNK76510.1 hypothetical protein [Maribacter sp.]